MTLDSNLESNSSQIAPAKAIVSEEIQKLEPSALIELFELTYTAAVNGIDQVVRYHAGTNEVKSDIVFGGNRYCSSVQIFPFFLVFLVKAFRQDQGPWFFRSKGVFDSDFNLRLDRPFHRERMKYF